MVISQKSLTLVLVVRLNTRRRDTVGRNVGRFRAGKHAAPRLVIEGRREIRIDNETKVIEFKGIVRRFDVSAMNTIESELVAEAHVSYIGTGNLTNATNRHGLGGWIHKALVWLWPF